MLGRTNASGSKIENENITVTKNGVYTKTSDDYTGLGQVTVNVTDDFTAKNKTGNTINKGGKVYLNIEKGAKEISKGIEYYCNGMFANGEYAFESKAIYDISNWEFKKIKDITVQGNTNPLEYFAERDINLAIYKGAINRVDINCNWSINLGDMGARYLGDGYICKNVNDNDLELEKIDLNTGNTLYKTETFTRQDYSSAVKIGNKLVVTKGNWAYRIPGAVYNIIDNGSSVKLERIKDYQGDELVIDNIPYMTADNKYLIGKDNGFFAIYSYNDEQNSFTKINLSTIPIFAKWENLRSLSIYFRKETGILTVCSYEGDGTYGFYKYKNGNFEELNFVFPNYTGDRLLKQLILSDDEAKFSNLYGYQGRDWTLFIDSTKAEESYNLVNYENINKDSVTGIANEEIANEQTGSISTLIAK